VTNTTWSPADSSKGITLSGSNLIATAAGSTDRGIRAGDEKTTGDFYFEVKYNSVAGNDSGAGICDHLANLGTIGSVALRAAIAFVSGNVWCGGSNRFNIGAIGAGDVLCVSVKTASGKVFLRKNAGNWNGSGTADPVTNTGGLDYAGAGLASRITPAACFNNTGDNVTANFGDTAFAFSVPSGFTAGWPTTTLPTDTLESAATPNATLTNGNLTVTLTANSAGGSVNTHLRSAGKFHLEVTANSLNTGGGAASAIVIEDITGTFAAAGTTSNSLAYIASTGDVKFNGSTLGTIATVANGDVIAIDLDIDNSKVWFSKNGGSYNNDILANQNPGSNTGGFSFSAMLHPITIGFTGAKTGDQWTVNNGGSAFLAAVPTGFTAGWPVSGNLPVPVPGGGGAGGGNGGGNHGGGGGNNGNGGGKGNGKQKANSAKAWARGFFSATWLQVIARRKFVAVIAAETPAPTADTRTTPAGGGGSRRRRVKFQGRFYDPDRDRYALARAVQEFLEEKPSAPVEAEPVKVRVKKKTIVLPAAPVLTEAEITDFEAVARDLNLKQQQIEAYAAQMRAVLRQIELEDEEDAIALLLAA
jgi:hypothetical protein